MKSRGREPLDSSGELDVLDRIVARLRGEGGCPWDREQTLDSLKRYLLEEAYEVVEVMAGGDPAVHCEELGDLLFQVVLQARIRDEAGQFALPEVIAGISEKLVRRHPHVFGDEVGADREQIRARWHELKQAEGGRKGTLADVPRALPALMRAEKVGKRAARVGFDWPDAEGPFAKVVEELGELREAAAGADPERVSAELGDLLFAAVNVARHLGVDPELALSGATERFLDRFAFVEESLSEQGRTPAGASLEELDGLWDAAKARAEGGERGDD